MCFLRRCRGLVADPLASRRVHPLWKDGDHRREPSCRLSKVLVVRSLVDVAVVSFRSSVIEVRVTGSPKVNEQRALERV